MTKRITDSSEVASFREAARRFCERIDARHEHGAPDLLRQVQAPLAFLVGTAMELPHIVRGGPVEMDDFGAEREEELRKALVSYFGDFDVFNEVYDPYLPEGPINGTLSDSLATIYAALEPGLSSWDSSSAGGRRTAVWDWQFTYVNMWGHHAIDAARAIHTLLFTYDIDEPTRRWPPAPEGPAATHSSPSPAGYRRHR